MILTCIADQDRPLFDTMTSLPVSGTPVYGVLIVEAATGTVKFYDLVTHGVCDAA